VQRTYGKQRTATRLERDLDVAALGQTLLGAQRCLRLQLELLLLVDLGGLRA
jgi:hypothetical protein